MIDPSPFLGDCGKGWVGLRVFEPQSPGRELIRLQDRFGDGSLSLLRQPAGFEPFKLRGQPS